MPDVEEENEQTMSADAELAGAACAGDAVSLGLLLERHRPGLYAHALRLLNGSPARAEDAVQETFLIALRSLSTVREPAAVGGWLHAVLRNACLMQLRGESRERPGDDVASLVDRTVWLSIEDEIDRQQLRQWIWEAIGRLSEPLQVPLMLRYFSGSSSYEQIAALCGAPLGTVRSRLHEAKHKLAEMLLDQAATVESSERQEAQEIAREFTSSIEHFASDTRPFLERCAADVTITLGDGPMLRGREHLADIGAADVQAGVSHRLTNVLASPRVVIAESRFENPPENPFHCPPGAVEVHYRADGWTQRITLRYTHDKHRTRQDEPSEP
jgi:RNA polymerase sigma factor (sigma-70 family)